MLNLDPAKLLVIGMIALIVLGPERLPRVARQLGGAWRELTRLRDQVSDEVRSAFPVEELPRMPNASAAVSGAISRITRPAESSVKGPGNEPLGDEDADTFRPGSLRSRPNVVIHPSLGEFAFLPDDPSMN